MTLEPPASRPLPDLIGGRYRIVSRLGVGGMGIVYKALDVQLNRSVAIKALEDRRLLVAGSAERLRSEAKAAASLDHPYVCKVYELVETPTDTFLVMEYIEGETLASMLKRGVLPLPQVLQLGREIAEGLANAHARGLVHRDVKPSNVMVTPHGHVKLLDFGVASTDVSATPVDATRTQLPHVTFHAGTPHYMSPEQAAGQPVTARADLFSLGVLLYECITGQLPFSGSTTFDYVRHVIQSAPRRLDRVAPDTPADLVDLIERCLEKSPASRPESADEVVGALTRLSESLTSTRTGFLTVGQRRSRQRVIGIAAAAAVVAAAAIGWLVWSSAAPPAPPLRQSRPFLTSAALEFGSRISPDAQWVAFLATEAGETRVLVQQIEGGEPRPLTLERGTPEEVIWSPDGRQIMVVMALDQARVLQIYPAFFGGASLRTTAFPKVDAGPSINQIRLLRWVDHDVYVEVRTDSKVGPALVRIATTGNDVREDISEKWPFRPVRGIDVSPDGRNVALLRIVDGQEDLWTGAIDGSNLRRVTEDKFIERRAIWNGRGDRIIFQSNRGGQLDLWEVDPESRAAVQLTSGDADTVAESTSADGSIISFNRLTQEARLWMWNPSTGAERQLTQDALSDYAPAVSADGKVISFQRSQPTPARGFTMLDAKLMVGRLDTGGGVTDLRTIGDAAAPTLSRDGAWIAFIEQSDVPAHGVLRVRNLTTGATQVASDSVRLPSISNRPVDWLSPVTAWTPAGELWFEDHTGVASINRFMPTEGKPATVVVRGEKESTWFRDITVSGDGETVAYLVFNRDRGNELFSIDVRTGQSRVLALLPLGGTNLFIRGWMDGAWILVHRTRQHDDFTFELEVLSIDGRTGTTRTIATVSNTLISTTRFDNVRRGLLVTRVEKGVQNLYELSLANGNLRALTRNTLPGVAYSGFQSVPAGVIGVRDERRQDIWLIQPATSTTGNSAGR